MIELEQLIACGLGPTVARMFVDPLNATFERFEINTPQRVAMFIAQGAHESRNFTHLEEDLYYTDPVRMVEQIFRGTFDLNHNHVADPEEIAFAEKYIRNPKALANIVYANRLGNGNEASGDGWRYRGGGIFQLTGRANYAAASDALGIDYEASPELVRLPEGACLTAGWYWANAHCNEAADLGDATVVTARINGPAKLGLAERTVLYAHMLPVFA